MYGLSGVSSEIIYYVLNSHYLKFPKDTYVTYIVDTFNEIPFNEIDKKRVYLINSLDKATIEKLTKEIIHKNKGHKKNLHIVTINDYFDLRDLKKVEE